ncbi:glycosyl hydrolase family, N-terminal domain-containing protein, partial [Schizophyllum fasciatum]
AAMTPGGTTVETTQLNIESLWSGGPFQNSSYNGGNKLPSDRHAAQEAMDRIRRDIFSSETGTVGSDGMCGRPSKGFPIFFDSFFCLLFSSGAYAGAGYLFTTIDASGKISDYARWLDLDQAVARTTWTQGGVDYNRTIFCSHPAQACVEHIAFSTPQTLPPPSVTFAYSVAPEPGLPPPNVTCLDDSTLRVRGYAGAPGMLYEILFRVLPGGADAAVSCAPVAAYDAAVAADFSGASARIVVWVGGTEYAMDGGDEAHAFAFRGPDPHEGLLARLAALRESSAGDLLDAHLADVDATLNHFRLDLGQ